MKYEVAETAGVSGEWRAEAFGADGECFVVLFAGPDAERRARAYTSIDGLLRNTHRVLDNYQNLHRDDPAQIQYALADISAFLASPA